MTNFFHLHTHSEYSLFDGFLQVREIVDHAKKNQMQAVGLTDHHNMFSWFPALLEEKTQGIRCLKGIELNIENHHITAFAINEDGLKNLIRLNNLAYAKGVRPKISEKQLFENKKGIVVLSGCMKGKIPQLLLAGQLNEANKTLSIYKEIFGENFYLELQNFNTNIYAKLKKEIEWLSRLSGIRIVATNDCHYLIKEQHEFHKYLVSLHTLGKVIPHNNQNYFKTFEELNELHHIEHLNNTEQIVEKDETDLEFFLKKQKNNYEVPISKIHYYDDGEAFKKVLFFEKRYALGEYWNKQIKKRELRLEDIKPWFEQPNLIDKALQLRGKIQKIESDPFHYIKTSEFFPIFKPNTKNEWSGQIDAYTASRLDLNIHDRRVLKCFF